MEEVLLGIDIGTSSCKVALFNERGAVLDQQTGSYNVYYPNEGWAEQDPNEWWTEVSKAIKVMLKRKKVDPAQIKGIGVDGQSWSAIPIDKNGTVLGNTPIWMDQRAQKICDEWNKKIGEEAFFKVSGNPFKPTYSLPKILWFKKHQPELFSNVNKFLQSNSYIVYKLTGKISQDKSQGYGLHCIDMRTGKYDQSMLEVLELSQSLFPEIYECHQIVGHTTEAIYLETGLPAGIPVVAGGLDAACGALGAGVISPGETQEQGGQAGGMSICIEEYKADPRLILSYHVVPNKWLLQGGTVGGAGVARWMLNSFCHLEKAAAKKNKTNQFYEMERSMKKIPAGSEGVIFLPYMAGERSPIWNPDAKGVYYGLDFTKEKEHLIRAGYEGVAFSLKHNLEVAESLGLEIKELRSIGGAANSLIWTQIKSDVTGKKIVVPSSDTATTLGAALLAGVAVGIYKDFEDAVEKTVSTQRVHDPDRSSEAVYSKLYSDYRLIYQQLKPVMTK